MSICFRYLMGCMRIHQYYRNLYKLFRASWVVYINLPYILSSHSYSFLKSHQELANRAGRRQAEGWDRDSLNFFATLYLFCSLHSTISKYIHNHTGLVESVPRPPLLVRVTVSSFQALAGTRLQVFIWLQPHFCGFKINDLDIQIEDLDLGYSKDWGRLADAAKMAKKVSSSVQIHSITDTICEDLVLRLLAVPNDAAITRTGEWLK